MTISCKACFPYFIEVGDLESDYGQLQTHCLFVMMLWPGSTPSHLEYGNCNSPWFRHRIHGKFVQDSVPCLLLICFHSCFRGIICRHETQRRLQKPNWQRFCQPAGATFQRRKMHPRSCARIVLSSMFGATCSPCC